MIVLDTTVLVYAKGADHPLREPCRELVAAVSDGRIEATTTAEAVQEFAHVYARRRERSEAAALARDYAALLSPLLRVEEAALERGLSLFESHAGLGAFDAVLAAASLEAGATGLVSADRAYAGVPRLDHIFPDADGVGRLLSGH